MTVLTVFDLDGTLIDSQRDLAASANQLIEECGGVPLPVDAVARMVGEGARLLVQRALAAAGVRDPGTSALERFLAIYDERLLDDTRPYDGVIDALAAAAARGPVAVLTNKPQHHTERVLAGLGLVRWFAEVIGGDTPFGRKPDPAGLRHLVARHGGQPATTVMVGDSVVDLRTARAAGVHACVARYGFGFRNFPPDERLDDASVIDEPGEFAAVLNRLARG